ncbi:Csu type fimbrial protein [Brevundimonas goettingensis]|uniref:Spore coat protein U domain-containing protein n=1 Tax=Brevundimonas goettingensis TaxID=2774190 RepID=A0A975GZ34_9CAUL|nr:spore coat U domain-containing protein [Brevundimonas goettingensis]QTC92245.1 spore coat protein U domain-containing protein [Brevundimonas goettingensis]
MRRIWLVGGLAAIVVPGVALAQTKTAQFAVRAQVVADCQVTAQDLNFGVYSSAAASTATTVVTVRCTPGSAATVSMDGGGSGNPQARRMSGPANLNYQIFRDAALQDPINTGGAAWQLSGQDNTGQTVTYTVYGQVPTGQVVPAGNYVDMVRVTIQF